MSEITGQEFGEITLMMLEKASWPGTESEKVTEMKALANQLKSGVKTIQETGEKKENEHQASSLKPAIMPSAIVTKLVDTARMARTQRDLAQVLYDESVDALKEHIGDAVGIDQLVAWFGVERTVVDAKKLKADHPEVYQKVAYQQKRRPFRLLDIGADE